MLCCTLFSQSVTKKIVLGNVESDGFAEWRLYYSQYGTNDKADWYPIFKTVRWKSIGTYILLMEMIFGTDLLYIAFLYLQNKFYNIYMALFIVSNISENLLGGGGGGGLAASTRSASW